MKVTGAEPVSKNSGALIVCNHLSWADASILLYVFKRPIRFLIFRDIHRVKIVNFFTAGINCIPISFEDSPKLILKALHEADAAIKNGELVCIFPEGEISRNGTLLPFKKGLKKLLQNPVVPVNLAGLAGSFLTPPLGSKNKRKLFGKVSVAVGEKLPTGCTVEQVREEILKLGRESFKNLFDENQTVGETILKRLRKQPFRKLYQDSEGRSLNGLTLYWAASHVAKSVEGRFGTLVPASCGAVVCTLAALLKDQEIVNLNYTADPNYPAEQANLDCVVTSQKLIKKTGLEVSLPLIFLEDILKRPNFLEISKTFFELYFKPRKFINQTAAILFTSGSTSKPKGVLLSHLNLLSNVEAIATVYNIVPSFKMLGILPPFHAFGLTGNILLPLLTGMQAMLHANPLESKSIEKLLISFRPNVLLTTPTFLRSWLKRFEAESFKSVEYLVAGAEPLPKALYNEMKEKTGVSILQGYGCTETSPVISVSLPEDSPSSSGRIVPGTAVKLDSEGRVLVSGTNLMRGYLGAPPQSEWYNTGDIGEFNDNQEMIVTGRASRFSKIAGEMVSHVAVEEAIAKEVLVVSVPEETKGELLVCLHAEEIDLAEVKAKIKQAGLPNLAVPKLLRVSEIPKTGTGKADLKKAEELAKESFC